MVIYQPEPDPKLPALALDVFADPQTVTAGMTIMLQIYLHNSAPNPATDVHLLLPLPDGVKLADGFTPSPIQILPQSTIPQVIQPVNPVSIPSTDNGTAEPVNIEDSPYPAPRIPLPSDNTKSNLADSATTPSEPPAIPQVIGPDRSQEQTHTLTQAAEPFGARRFSLPAFAPGKDIEWVLPQLNGQQQIMVSVTLQVHDPINLDALVFEPRCIVHELSNPILGIGGVLVEPATEAHDHANFAPGQQAILQSPNGRVRVTLPANAHQKGLTLRYDRLRDEADVLRRAGRPIPYGGLFGRAALDAFSLTATDTDGKTVDSFDMPLTLSVEYSEDQLRARGLVEGNLSLAWFNEQTMRWEAVATTVDSKTYTASASINHFSVWELSDGSSPSMAFVPTLQGFQTSTFTGAASYSIAMDVPAGAAGHRPNLGLNYSSAATDGTPGMRHKAQAGWVGKGWSLNTGGSVARIRHKVGEDWDYFSFSFGGKSYDIVRGTQFQSLPNIPTMATLTRPGDISAAPTIMALYADMAIPFRYQIARKASMVSGDTYQDIAQIYDAFGHKVQEKRETEGGYTRLIVTDSRYDALDRVVETSQPRYDSGSWNSYTPISNPLYRATTTQYDALGRVLRLTKPDTSFSEQRYTLGSLGPITESYDANQHKRTLESDSLGRLRTVIEYSGNNGSEGAYAAYASTSYSYDALDRLIQATDAKNNITTISYDALGRKTNMIDPDMGAWSYSYDVNGTLHSQTDARGIVTTFSYDVLDRLTNKNFSAGGDNRVYGYDEPTNR